MHMSTQLGYYQGLCNKYVEVSHGFTTTTTILLLQKCIHHFHLVNIMRRDNIQNLGIEISKLNYFLQVHTTSSSGIDLEKRQLTKSRHILNNNFKEVSCEDVNWIEVTQDSLS